MYQNNFNYLADGTFLNGKKAGFVLDDMNLKWDYHFEKLNHLTATNSQLSNRSAGETTGSSQGI
jgi:hypothetical protein